MRQGGGGGRQAGPGPGQAAGARIPGQRGRAVVPQHPRGRRGPACGGRAGAWSLMSRPALAPAKHAAAGAPMQPAAAGARGEGPWGVAAAAAAAAARVHPQVFHVGGGGQLPAGGNAVCQEALADHGVQLRAGCVDGGRVGCWAAANDGHVRADLLQRHAVRGGGCRAGCGRGGGVGCGGGLKGTRCVECTTQRPGDAADRLLVASRRVDCC